MPWSLFFECWAFSQLFHSPLSPSSRGSLVPLHFLPYSLSAHLRLLIFFPEVLLMLHQAWHFIWVFMNITSWTIPNQIYYILCSWRKISSIQSTKTRPGASCGSDHELLIENSDLNWESRECHSVIKVWTKSNSLWLYSGSEK